MSPSIDPSLWTPRIADLTDRIRSMATSMGDILEPYHLVVNSWAEQGWPGSESSMASHQDALLGAE